MNKTPIIFTIKMFYRTENGDHVIHTDYLDDATLARIVKETTWRVKFINGLYSLTYDYFNLNVKAVNVHFNYELHQSKSMFRIDGEYTCEIQEDCVLIKQGA